MVSAKARMRGQLVFMTMNVTWALAVFLMISSLSKPPVKSSSERANPATVILFAKLISHAGHRLQKTPLAITTLARRCMCERLAVRLATWRNLVKRLGIALMLENSAKVE